VANGLLLFSMDMAEDLGGRALALRMMSACSILSCLSVPKRMDLGKFPILVLDNLKFTEFLFGLISTSYTFSGYTFCGCSGDHPSIAAAERATD
jgi:hypothetical protein